MHLHVVLRTNMKMDAILEMRDNLNGSCNRRENCSINCKSIT